MLSFYKANANLMFRRAGIFEQNFTLEDLENMLPFEREVYLIQIESKIIEYEQEQAKKQHK